MQGTTNESHEDTLDQTIAALEAGPASLNPDTGLAIVDRWHAAVLAEDDMDLSDVASGLEELRDLLGADALDGGAIGDVLIRLGEATETAAQQADDAQFTPMLERLATLLSRGGNALAGARARSTATDRGQGR